MMQSKQIQKRQAVYEWVQTLVCSVLVVVLLFVFVARVIVVDGESMRETLQDQDILLVLNDKLSGEYKAGDIIVLRKAT